MSDKIELPADRELALHEINSLLTEIKSRDNETHVYTKKAWVRDRIMGWVILSVLVAAVGWTLFYQYASTQELRRSLYETCVDNNSRSAAQRDLYDQVAQATESPEFKVLMEATSSRLASRDCKTLYLQ